MAKSIDYAKIKAMASSILECIGDCDEGENPDLPKQKQDIDDGGQSSMLSFSPNDQVENEQKDKKGDKLALMAATLSRKVK